MSPEERRKRMEERLASMTPEERERFQQRMREREAQGGGFGGGAGQAGNQAVGGGRGQGPGGQQNVGRGSQGAGQVASRGMVGNVSGGTATSSGAMTIDSLFAPLQVTETRGRVWLYENKQLKSVQLRLGVSDGTFSEIIEGDVKEGQEVVTNFVTGLETAPRPGQQQGTGNPLMGPQRGGGGGRGGGGRGF
jgi:HlyD family secretion protein